MGSLGKWLICNLPFVAEEHDLLQGDIGLLQNEIQNLKVALELCCSDCAATVSRLKGLLVISDDLHAKTQDKLAATIVELESTKRKIVATPPEQPILKAKTAAEARKLAEQAFAREEEQVLDGIQ